jgi:hypothetical protein
MPSMLRDFKKMLFSLVGPPQGQTNIGNATAKLTDIKRRNTQKQTKLADRKIKK